MKISKHHLEFLDKQITESVAKKQLSLFEDVDNTIKDDKKILDQEISKLKYGKVKINDVIETINAIRAGQSLHNKEIEAALTIWFNNLKIAEKVALYAFLKGILEIVSGTIPEKATSPSPPPSNVDMKKKDIKYVKHVEPNVIKKDKETEKAENEEETTKEKENTKAPLPIKVKK